VVGVVCKGAAKYILIYAMTWNSIAWERHRRSFEKLGVAVVKRGMCEPPIRCVEGVY